MHLSVTDLSKCYLTIHSHEQEMDATPASVANPRKMSRERLQYAFKALVLGVSIFLAEPSSSAHAAVVVSDQEANAASVETSRRTTSTTTCYTDGTANNAQKLSVQNGNLNSFYTLGADDQFGWDVAGLGDLDGDGVVDLAVGARTDDDGGSNAGAVYVLFLETSGNVKNAQKISAQYGNLGTFYTLDASDLFGWSVAAPGDVDGDGVADLVVGAEGDDDGSSGAGAAYVLFLETNGKIKSAQKISMLYGNFDAFYTLDVDDQIGMCVASLGDIDSDSLVDIAVGAHQDDDGGSNAGAVYIFFLDTNAYVKSAQKLSAQYGSFGTFYTLDADDMFGRSAAGLGDVTGNGVIDLAVGVH